MEVEVVAVLGDLDFEGGLCVVNGGDRTNRFETYSSWRTMRPEKITAVAILILGTSPLLPENHCYKKFYLFSRINLHSL